LLNRFDRAFQPLTWVLLALMAVSLFALDNAFTTPLLGVYVLLLAVRHRSSIADTLRSSTPKQKGLLVLTFVGSVALSFVLIRFGGRFLESQGIGPVFLYIWIALVIGIAVAILLGVASRFGLTSESRSR